MRYRYGDMDWGRLTPTEHWIMDQVRSNVRISRTALVRLSDLTQSTIHRAVDRLTERGLIEQGEAVTNGRGKPSPQLGLKSEGAYSLGLSIVEDGLCLLQIDLEGKVCDRWEFEGSVDDPNQIVRLVGEQVRRFATPGSAMSDRLAGLGVAFPGFRTHGRSQFRPTRPLRAWDNLDITELFEAELGIETTVENDANCEALAENFVGAGRACSCFGYLSLGFGFGASVILNGQILLGANRNAGEIGKIFTNDQMKHRPAIGELILRLQDGGTKIENLRQLEAFFDPEWPSLANWIEEISPYLNLAIRAMAAIVDPEKIIIGGRAPLGLRQMIQTAAQTELIDRWGRNFPLPSVSCSLLADPAGLGAAYLSLKKEFFERRASTFEPIS